MLDQVTLPDGGLTTTGQNVPHTIWPCPALGHAGDIPCEQAIQVWAKQRRIKVIVNG